MQAKPNLAAVLRGLVVATALAFSGASLGPATAAPNLAGLSAAQLTTVQAVNKYFNG